MKAILALNQNNIIGANNDLPWWIPEDMIMFKEKTLGKTVVMGRKTFESLNLPNGLPFRTNYVLTSDENFKSDSVKTIRSWSEISALEATSDVFIIGGGALYNFGFQHELFSEIYVTQVLQEQPIDEGIRINIPLFQICMDNAFSPNWEVIIDERGWQQSVRGSVFRFVTIRRKKNV